MFPTPAVPTDKIPESKKHIDKRLHKVLYRFFARRLPGAVGGVPRAEQLPGPLAPPEVWAPP
jgi:hypothetical protein